MFTGLVETLGTVAQLRPDGAGGAELVVRAPSIAPHLALGESVAVNGACLTVVAHNPETCRFQLGPETLRCTNLGILRADETVNLERALRVGDRLGGHFVQGHVDAVGTIAKRAVQGDWVIIDFACPAELLPYMVAKGSVAVDGVSLTVVSVAELGFRVMLIPHTLTHTTLGRKNAGAAVNIETDILAKYVRRPGADFPLPGLT